MAPEQELALIAYARAHGRRWKSALRHEWEAGCESAELQQLRNSPDFGPLGLIKYRLPVVVRS